MPPSSRDQTSRHHHRKLAHAMQSFVDQLNAPTTTAAPTVPSTTTPTEISPDGIAALTACHERFVAVVARHIVAASQQQPQPPPTTGGRVQRVRVDTVDQALHTLQLSSLLATIATAATIATTQSANSNNNNHPISATGTKVSSSSRPAKRKKWSPMDEAEQERLLALSKDRLVQTVTVTTELP